MSVFIVSGSNNPESTHVVMGGFETGEGIKEINIDINAIQDQSKKDVYDAFFGLVGNNVSVEIINSPYNGDFNHVSMNIVDLNAVVIDYQNLDLHDKKVIDDAFALLENV